MRKMLTITIALLAISVARSARASSITFSLDCQMTAFETCGSPNGTPTGAYGTVVVSDDLTNSNWVDIAVNLASPAGRDITKLFLNYSNFPLPSGYGFTATGASVFASQDNEDQGIYGMMFDLVTSPIPAGNPFTTILKLQKSNSPDLNLDASNFDLKDANNLLYAAVNYSGVGPQEGALVSDHGAVPEPATLTLVALGLGALARRRRPMRSSQ